MRLALRWIRPLLTCIAFASCTSWQARPLSMLQAPLSARDRVELWSRGHSFDVHGVVVRGDSVQAVRYFQSLSCESCMLRLALRDIDSVRVQRYEGGQTGGLTVGFLLVGLIVYLIVNPPVWGFGY